MLEQLLTDPEKIGIIGLLSLWIVAFMRGWIVTGAAYVQMKAERDEFKAMIIQSADTTDRALRTAVHVVKSREQ